ncbi:MAG: hypothetical protein LLG06_05910 [Desulfobacteraceae bacterium]|nr:hypothetical protein [Desulfobacteraceae bacterium]
MPIAHIQSATNRTGSNVSSLSKAFLGNVSLGNLIVVCVGTKTGVLPSGGCSDSLGNSYSQAVVAYNDQGSNVRYAAIYYAIVTTAGACTVTVTPSSSCPIAMSISEFSGCAGSSPLDTINSGIGSSTAPSSGSVTPNGSDLLVGSMTFEGSAATITSDSDYTEIYAYGNASPYLGTEYRLNRSSADAADWTLQYTRQWVAVIAAFKPSGTVHTVSCSDGMKGGETNSTACTFAGAVSDGLSGGESLAPSCSYPVSGADGFNLSDLVSVSLSIALTASDGAQLADGSAVQCGFSPSVFSGLNLAEAVSVACALHAGAVDGFSVRGVCGPGNLYTVTADDGIEASEVLSAVLQYAATVNAGIEAGEIASAECRFEVSVSDVSKLADVVAAVCGFALSVTDGCHLSGIAIDPLGGQIGGVRISFSASARTFIFEVKPKAFTFIAN